VTAVICAVTAVYALITYEILVQNQAMAKAATDSTRVMQQTLRFSYAPNLLYRTINRKDPIFKSSERLTPIDNEDYQTALSEHGEGKQQKEFVFAIVQNVGRGAATNLKIGASYDIRNSSNPTKNYSVKKVASVQLLEPGCAVALCICVYKVPSSGDRVQIVSAHLTTSDFYLDALKEPAQTIQVAPNNHHFESEKGSVVQLI
jgi:hypothetical protein